VKKQRLYPLPTRGDWTFSRQDLLSAGRPEFVPDPDIKIRPNTTWATREEEDYRPCRISFNLGEYFHTRNAQQKMDRVFDMQKSNCFARRRPI
jgi:hypothetical protein